MSYNKKDRRFYNDWVEFYWKFNNFYLMYNLAGYFDRRPQIHCSVTQVLALLLLPFLGFHWYSLVLIPLFCTQWGDLYINLPIQSRYDECEPPRYGIYYHSAGIWICYGRKIKCIHMPYEYDWVRTSRLLEDGTWDHETKHNRRHLFNWNRPTKSPIWKEEHPYTYVLKNGTAQQRTATIRMEEREWRMHWLKWTSLFSKTRKTIDVDFTYGGPIERGVLLEKKLANPYDREHTGEVGEETGSYKGGTTGCSYEILPGETPLASLRRMEKERKF